MDRDHVMFPGKLTEMPDLYRAAAPINHVTRDDAPMLILHGTADTTTPLSGSGALRRQARGGRRRAPARDRRGAPHSFDLQPTQRDLRELVIGFFDKHLRGGKP